MRATLDKLISWTGLLLAAVLLVAGGLLTWAYVFINDQVDQQLSQQHITMPTEEAFADFDQADQDALKPYAGEPMTTGAQAKAYADHYILVHMNEASGGKAYADVSGEQRQVCSENPDSDQCAQLTGLKATLFQGSTLRGLLLYGYAFGTMGTIALWAAIGAYVGAVLFLILGVLGLMHARRAAAES